MYKVGTRFIASRRIAMKVAKRTGTVVLEQCKGMSTGWARYMTRRQLERLYTHSPRWN